MQNLPESLVKKLYQFNQRLLNKGELVLLAKAISDEIAIPSADMDNIKIYVLSYKYSILTVIDSLQQYISINEEQLNAIFELINEFIFWRFNVAYKPSYIFFTGQPETIVDDLTLLPRYVDKMNISAVADVSDNANFLYGVFREVITTIGIKKENNESRTSAE